MKYPDGDKQIQISKAQMIEEYPAAPINRDLRQARENALAVSVQIKCLNVYSQGLVLII
jgi:hypothetical protein